ncbi:PLP-dependent aminotransferase family protein [Vibrio sp. CAU 1672]|uniref:aminotransferase-like domain-containing protein n=1 Tax=Vibrio sp. CAU 1672 TaxID=3032594 RepID=UPI0023DAFA85|nr:PLP-dependent aminotransferase family protein [Vibrio sp. CAU 1672]MDF2152843.1 PLP-dependent aminotransferase family protein [Vibrio sp. CAU 1672]
MSSAKFVKIAKVIERRINKGEYQPNSKLPTHRELASDLDTTPATIAKAYSLLVDKGRVESHVGRGTYVCAKSDLGKAIQAPDDKDDYNFSILQPCLYKNVDAIQKAYKLTADSVTSELIGYVERSGHEAHRQAGSTWAKHFGLEGGNAANTILTNGAQHALSLLINALTKPGDTIAVESLTYPGIFAIANLSGRNIVGVPLDEHGVSPEALDSVIVEHKPKLVIIIPSHQNPTGITMPAFRREEVAKVVSKHNIWLVEDDIYCFLDEKPIPAISNFIPEQAFHISALSKAISPAMRCGFIKVPDSQIGLINAHVRASIWLPSPINFSAATHLIESGEAFDLAQSQRITAQERQSLARQIMPSIQCRSTGYHIWLPLPNPWKAEHLVQEAKNQNLLVSSGSYFDVNGMEASHIRLSLMSVSTEERLQEGMSKLKNLLSSSVNTLFPC